MILGKFIKSICKDNELALEKMVAREIGYWVFEKNKHNAGYALDEIKSYGITQIKVKNGHAIEIRLSRPGILIGFRGRDIESLKTYLNTKLHRPLKIRIVEERVLNHLWAFNTRD